MHLRLFGPDDGHQCDALGGDGDQITRPDIPAGADTVRIAHYETVAVTDETSDSVATIPIFGGFA